MNSLIPLELNRFIKILRNTVLILVGLLAILILLVNLTPVQNFAVKKTTEWLARKLNTKVSIKHVRVDFLNHLLIQGLYIEDQQKDTLLYAGEARVRITDWFILRKEKPVLRYVGLHNAYAHLYRTASSDKWNYQFVVDAFDTGKKDTTKTQNEFELDLEKVDLQNVRFHMDDAWVGSDMDIDVGSFAIDAKEIDLKKRVINVNTIDGDKLAFIMRDYVGGRPPRVRKARIIDNTPFNTGNWKVSIDGLNLTDSRFAYNSGSREPYVAEFDPMHMDVTSINIDAKNIRIAGDTVKGKLMLAANERSGFKIKKLTTDATVSPNATICKNLYLETNNSKLQHYYAMYYERFPDFEEYIDKVVMVANLNNSIVDSRDVAYFAPVLRRYPTIVKASGRVAGTVDSLVGQNLQLNDGNMMVKGDLKMFGLPDIYTTWIDYSNGEIYTNGNAIIRYAPELRNNPNIALERITHAYFKGNFTGYLENFAADGILATNLGVVRSNVKMKLPEMRQKHAAYSGTITTEQFNLGALLKQSQLGTITLRSNVTGNAFEPKDANIKLDGVIDQFEFNGYNYRNITANGLLERNRFSGDLLVDDPNLALAFQGNIDLSQKQLDINATANILKSNLNALKLTKDSMTIAADVDIDLIGNNLDDFLGFAKLYNINLIRNNHRLDLDSVYINSAIAGGKKHLTIESNALHAELDGAYQLTTLPLSFQYYISNYLPNYIKAPTKYAPDQDISFNIITHEIDSLLGVIVPDIKGFNNATISGALNTSRQQLTLKAEIPYGKIQNVTLQKVNINSTGDLRQLGINAEADDIALGDELNGSISVTTTLGSDSMLFNIATTSTGSYGTATINGRAYASGDSMYFSLLPSEFFLKKNKWEIAGGSNIIVSDQYLFVKNLNIQSGLQRIEINSLDDRNKQAIVVNTRELDVAQLGAIAGLSDYQPDGRINGTIKIENPLTNTFIATDLNATDVKIGADTVGSVKLVGTYDLKKHIVNLDPLSGVYKGNASIITSGKVFLFDSTSNQRLDGQIQFNNAPVAWASPLLVGFVSNLSGVLNGTIDVKGTGTHPDIDGSVRMDNAALHLDFLGTDYNIHTATIKINNKEIDFGNITVFDAYKNRAILAGKITHDRFRNMRFAINAGSSKFQVLDLDENESEAFYGTLIAGFQNLSIRGPIDNIQIRITRAMPMDKSHLYIPIGTTTTSSSYNYVTFKNYGTTQTPIVKKKRNKLNISIDARLNNLAEITLVLDPSTGDAINATGTGNLNMEIPSDDDIRMNGRYDIEHGNYMFTLKQLFFKRNFALYPGSRINFNGLISQTEMDVHGAYTVRTRLYELLEVQEREAIKFDRKEETETKASQDVNVLLHMRGSLEEPKLSFKLGLSNNRAAGTFAYTKMERINQNETQLFNQVASLLLIGSFVPAGNDISGNTASAGAISNVGEILSVTASSQLTNIISRITGDKSLSLDFRYKQFSFTEASTTPGNPPGLNSQNRNEISLGARKNLLNDRLTFELGSSYDWGRQSAGGSKFTPGGNFRTQYQFKEGGNLRSYAYGNYGNFDVLGGRVNRFGIGISWRKSFDNFGDFFRGAKYARKQLEMQQQAVDSTRIERIGSIY